MTNSLQPGEVIASKYRVERPLGEGGMGLVVAATDCVLERPVAIKVLSVQHRKNEEAVARFLQEARAAVRLQSEHVVKVYDVGTHTGGSPFIVMEILRGADLSDILDSEGALSVHDALTFLLQACDAVAEAHVQGIVHRDLKPANLFLSRQLDGSSIIKVLDFGISKLTMPAGPGTLNPSLTRTSYLLGSPTYMSPEQLKNARDVDGRADIWALGIILFELVVGRTPFEAESMAELSANILTQAAPVPSQVAPSPLPDGLDAVILKALEKDREQRYHTVAEFVLALAPYAPRRMWPIVEKVARLQHAGDASSELLPMAPTAPPEATWAARTSAQTSASWGITANPTQRQARLRRPLVVAAAGAALLLAAASLVLFAGSPATAVQDPQRAVAAVPVPVPPSRAAMDMEPRAAPVGESATPVAPSEAFDAGVATDAAVAESTTATAAAQGSAQQGRAKPSLRRATPRGASTAQSERRAVFGGRK